MGFFFVVEYMVDKYDDLLLQWLSHFVPCQPLINPSASQSGQCQ
jgi:hypothetical protein